MMTMTILTDTDTILMEHTAIRRYISMVRKAANTQAQLVSDKDASPGYSLKELKYQHFNLGSHILALHDGLKMHFEHADRLLGSSAGPGYLPDSLPERIEITDLLMRAHKILTDTHLDQLSDFDLRIRAGQIRDIVRDIGDLLESRVEIEQSLVRLAGHTSS